MPYDPPPELAALSLSEVAEWAAARKLPPVETWAPAREGDSHMEIAADGRWFHEGGEITRPAMVRAFAGLLLRDGESQHWLVTPHERLRIAVADAAFIATDVARKDGSLAFRLNTDELVLAGPDHPLRAAGSVAAPALYLAVRHGCEARLNRSTWEQLAEIAIAEAGADTAPETLTIASGGVRFALVPPA